MRIRVIAIEDEPLALKKLVGFIEKIDYLELSKTFDNAIDAISFLKKNSVDLIFLDIHMEEFTGIQFLETLKHRPKVIITSAYDKYALKGYELDVVDYLLKPFTFDRFLMSVEKIAANYQENSIAVNSIPNYIFIKSEGKLEKIKIADILYIEGKSEYLQVITFQKKVMTLLNFKTMEEILPNIGFARVHKSYVVALDKIESIERNRIKINEVLIPISDSYKAEFFRRIGVEKQ